MLPAENKIRFKAAPFSGIFLDYPNVEGKRVNRDQMKHVVEMQNCSHTLNAKCQANLTGEDSYKCFFGQYSMEYMDVPIFVLDSPYDTIGVQCIVLGEPVVTPSASGTGNCSAVPGWEKCSKGDCTPEQWKKIEGYADAYRTLVKTSPKLQQNGNGVYEYSCFTHAIEATESWAKITVEKTLMRDAVKAWFFSDNEPTSKHFYEDCNNTDFHSCNPTCNKDPVSSSSSDSSSFVYPTMSITAVTLAMVSLFF